MLKKVVFLGTGGTIAGTAASASDNVGYKAAQVGIDQLLASSPALRKVLDSHDVEAEQVLQVNSKDMEFSGWQRLLERVVHHLARAEVASVLITHGTDTLEESAYFLHRTIPAELLVGKAVILTCAMRPSSSSNADGPGNLCDAAALAISPMRAGVMVVCGGKVHSGLHVQKVHPYRLDPFDSRDAGPLGFVEEGVFRRIFELPTTQENPIAVDLNRLFNAVCPRVEVLVSHSGSTGAIVHALMNDSNNAADPLRGIVVAGTGNATVHERMQLALVQAQQAGIRVLRSTRCAYGEAVGGGASMPDELPAANTSAVKARIDLMLELIQ